MTVKKIADYAVCRDCFDYHMGWLDALEIDDIDRCKRGFTLELSKYYRDDEYLKAILFWEEGSDAEDQEFSWQPCEVCGSALGGQRLTLTLMHHAV
jgi:hypothetical protein